jgi:acetyl-CoA acyltransferase
MIKSGYVNTVLIIGAEKMTSVPSRRSTSIIASLLSERERKSGLTLPSLAAFMAKAYMREYGVGMEMISSVAVKNHRNGALNQYAHFQKPVDLSDIMKSKIIADPLRLYDFCPVSDGAASLILTRDDMAQSFTGKAVKIRGISSYSSNPVISERKSLLEIDCVKEASDKVFKETGLTRKDVDFAEVHDMSTILEIVESENIGFFEKGSGYMALRDGITEISGELPINPSGGLNSKGHPIGATGVAQACEVYQQINGLAGPRQVKRHEVGFTLNMAGFGNNAVAGIYEAFS